MFCCVVQFGTTAKVFAQTKTVLVLQCKRTVCWVCSELRYGVRDASFTSNYLAALTALTAASLAILALVANEATLAAGAESSPCTQLATSPAA